MTPDTSYYLLLGYAAFAILGAGYMVSLVSRYKKLRAEKANIKLIGETDTDNPC